MRREGIRRIPVVSGNGALLGIVTFDDLLESISEELNEVAKVISRERVVEERKRTAIT